MQNIYDLTKEQVNALTDDEIQTFIDIECAEKGVLLLPDVPTEPKKELPKPDLTIYAVGDFRVESFEEASQILEILSKVRLVTKTYDYNVGYDFHYIRFTDFLIPEIKKEFVYSAELYNQLKNAMRKYSQEKTNYDNLNREYQKADKERQGVASKVWEYINDIRDEFWQKEHLTKEFNRYLVLANGDKKIAMAFFVTAYSDQLNKIDDPETFKSKLME
jgi:hypothetical protein